MDKLKSIKQQISSLLLIDDFNQKVNFINELREHIHELSPFKNEPSIF